MIKISNLFIIPLLTLSFIAFGQSESKKKEIREKMWETQDKDFSRTETPEKWKNESAVILCRSMEYQVKKEVFLTYVYENLYSRNRIKLLDQAAVKEYSELSFAASQSQQMDAFGSSNTENVFVGIKVIKPNGQEREVTQKDAVVMEAKQGYNKEKYNKVAVPDLEPGDIIDYYYCIEKSTMYGSFDKLTYALAGRYPILKQKMDVKIMRKCHLSAKSLNGAPELKRNLAFKNEDVYSLVDENREKVEADQKWMYIYRTVPTINFCAYYVSKKSGWETHFLGKQGEVHHSISEGNLLNYVNMITTRKKKYYPYSAAILTFMNSNYRKEKNPEIVAREAYEYMRQRSFAANYEEDILNNRNYNYGLGNLTFMLNMSKFLQKKKVNHDIILTTPRSLSDIKDLVLQEDLVLLIRVNTPQPFYMSQLGRFYNYNEVQQEFEGTNAYTVNMLKKSKLRDIQKTLIPASTNEANNDRTTLDVTFSSDDANQLVIKRTVASKGQNRFPHMSQALTPYEYLNDGKLDKYMITLKEKQSMSKKAKAEIEKKVAQKKEQDAKERLDRMKEELESELTAKVTAYKNFSLQQTGLWGEKPEIQYNDEYTVEGLLVKNGPNYLLDAGKLIGKQIELQKTDLSRKDDIYMPYARSFAYSIDISIPEGYEVKGLEKFNSKVINSTGGFVSNAVVKGNKVSITTQKYYTHNFEKASSWSDVVAFLEASYQFTQQKLLFKKSR